MREPPDEYSIHQSYEKERNLQVKSRQQEEISLFFNAFSSQGWVGDSLSFLGTFG